MAYWEVATSAGDPLIPRSVVFLHKAHDDGDDEGKKKYIVLEIVIDKKCIHLSYYVV